MGPGGCSRGNWEHGLGAALGWGERFPVWEALTSLRLLCCSRWDTHSHHPHPSSVSARRGEPGGDLRARGAVAHLRVPRWLLLASPKHGRNAQRPRKGRALPPATAMSFLPSVLCAPRQFTLLRNFFEYRYSRRALSPPSHPPPAPPRPPGE